MSGAAAIPTHLERLLATLPPDVAAAVRASPELFQAQQNEIILRGISRALDLLTEVPELFRRRHWPHHEDSVAFATAAICFYRWGQVADPRAFDVRLRTPPGPRFDEAWRALHALERPRARDVVRVLDLGELLPAAGVAFSPIEDVTLAPG